MYVFARQQQYHFTDIYNSFDQLVDLTQKEKVKVRHHLMLRSANGSVISQSVLVPV